MEKVKIFHDVASYDYAKQCVDQKAAQFRSMLACASEHIAVPTKDYPEFKAKPVEYFQKTFMLKNEGINTMKLRYERLIELLEINVAPFMKSAANYTMNDWPDEKQVRSEDFWIYAETKEQIGRYNDLKPICDQINTLKVKNYRTFSTMTVAAYFGGMMQFDINTGVVYPNTDFVLNG